ncbi:hypothetical protein KP509_08G014700 [Ceratopteris richardii]|uniref:Uncharacterized protein n=1 Tax=Ceratopteris richardii TaxID=49495 RepID=A0A8T2U628_CERRI|nr:hypothetical protein KP509_08G014700 [Ceratopteris richardii]
MSPYFLLILGACEHKRSLLLFDGWLPFVSIVTRMYPSLLSSARERESETSRKTCSRRKRAPPPIDPCSSKPAPPRHLPKKKERQNMRSPPHVVGPPFFQPHAIDKNNRRDRTPPFLPKQRKAASFGFFFLCQLNGPLSDTRSDL